MAAGKPKAKRNLRCPDSNNWLELNARSGIKKAFSALWAQESSKREFSTPGLTQELVTSFNIFLQILRTAPGIYSTVSFSIDLLLQQLSDIFSEK